MEIVNKDTVTKEDMDRAKVLVDILGTVSTINEYHKAAPNMHRSPMQEAINADYFGVRPGTKIHKMTPEEEEQLLKELAANAEKMTELYKESTNSTEKMTKYWL